MVMTQKREVKKNDDIQDMLFAVIDVAAEIGKLGDRPEATIGDVFKYRGMRDELTSIADTLLEMVALPDKLAQELDTYLGDRLNTLELDLHDSTKDYSKDDMDAMLAERDRVTSLIDRLYQYLIG